MDQASLSAATNPYFRELAVDLLLEPRIPARQAFDSEKFAELVDSIRHFGRVLEPLIVEVEDMRYRIHAGHRRWEAAKVAGVSTVPCMVWLAGTVPGEAVKSHENAVREDLNVAEEAMYFRTLLEGLCENDVDRLAALVGQRAAYVQKRLALILGDPRVFDGLAAGLITIGVAEELNLVKHDGYRLQLLTVAAQGGCSVRQARDWRIAGNQQYADNPGNPVAPMPESPAPPQPESHHPRCIFCGSDHDQYEMQVRWVHVSCEKAAQRQAEARQGAA
jgi:ParB/RepB/Spo0J family partition protein